MFDVIGLPVEPAVFWTAKLARMNIGLCMSDGVAWAPWSWPST
jgi:hypothetical protein